jgi:simple sugar transport system permease protein
MIGRLGLVAAGLAFWLTLPPVETSAVAVPALLGAVAVACGGWAVAHGQRRLGWTAVALGVLGAVLGLLATHAGRGSLDATVVWSALIAAMLINATPLTYAAIGGLFSERSGVVNIGLEGMMLMGAFFGIWGSDVTGSWELGLLIAIAAGGLAALVYAFFAIHVRTDQIIGGTAVNFLALGVTGYLFVDIYGTAGTPALRGSQQIPDVTISHGSGFLAQAFGQLNLMIWLSFAVLALTAYVASRRRQGSTSGQLASIRVRARSLGNSATRPATLGRPVRGAVRDGRISQSATRSFNENAD